MLENETTILTCSAGESNPAVSITWFVSVDEKLIRLSEADIETVTEPSGYGWTVVSKAVVTGSLMDTLQVVCLAQIDSIGFKREARHTVDVHSMYKDKDSITKAGTFRVARAVENVNSSCVAERRRGNYNLLC